MEVWFGFWFVVGVVGECGFVDDVEFVYVGLYVDGVDVEVFWWFGWCFGVVEFEFYVLVVVFVYVVGGG